MRLNWITHYDKIDNTHLQEVFMEHERGLVNYGRKIVYCSKHKGWTTDSDYRQYCRDGLCEFSEHIRLPKS